MSLGRTQKTIYNEVCGLINPPILMCTKHSPFTGINYNYFSLHTRYSKGLSPLSCQVSFSIK